MPNLFSLSKKSALSETAVVARHITFTVANVASKVIYGISITLAAQDMIKAEGYDYETMENAQ